MDNSWQMVLTLFCVSAAVGQLTYRVWRLCHDTQTPGSCGSACNSCPSNKPGKIASEGLQLIQLEVKSGL